MDDWVNEEYMDEVNVGVDEVVATVVIESVFSLWPIDLVLLGTFNN